MNRYSGSEEMMGARWSNAEHKLIYPPRFERVESQIKEVIPVDESVQLHRDWNRICSNISDIEDICKDLQNNNPRWEIKAAIEAIRFLAANAQGWELFDDEASEDTGS